ncbi:efflux RND transporter permease subunit [Motiliproteus sp. MSK22-1]|uniref:efflux RND transporter permease subunit n=1 Tax=Motiliproteus sp. MSK22-1 TaxID=1897630 RepID=UPI000978BFA5|nr:efflux RND transporter permease subunit [Motiliproteus sp. MSK22-1]OMH32811.1 hypothetical protein BGP75_14925 [Motiliproteus sp. MSK22-1]
MKLSKVVIDHSAFTIILLLILVLVGLLSFVSMPRSEDPQFSFAAAGITIIYPGVSPLDLESLVVDPLEEEINGLDDIKRIETRISDGVVSQVVEFVYGTDPDDAYDEVRQAVSGLRNDLPAGIVDVEIRRLSPTEVNVLQLALVSDESGYFQLNQLAENLKQGLERIPGVKRAKLWGVPQQQIEVALDWERMSALGLTAQQVVNVLQDGSRNLAGGFVNAGASRFSVSTSGSYQSLQQIRDTVVHSVDDRLLRLAEVATVQQGDADDSHIARLDGKRSVFVTLTQSKGSNIFELREGINRYLTGYQKSLPASVSLQVAFDQAPSVDRQVNGFFDNLSQGLALVGLLVLLVLGFRAALVIMVAIPTSLLIAIGWIDLSGFGLQQMTIVGLIVALGLLVDNAIVLTESIGRAGAEGFQGVAAAYEGARRVGWAMVSGTLTTALAFLPMLMLPNNTGSFMRSMPATVILTLLASLLVALTLSTLLAGRFLITKEKKLPLLQRGLKSFSETGYRSALSLAISYPWLTLLLAILIFLSSLSLVPKVGVSLFPKAEKALLLINIETPQNGSIYRTQKVVRDVSDWLAEQPLVSSIVENIGADNPRIYYNEAPERGTPNQGQLLVHLSHYDGKAIGPLIDNWRRKLEPYPGVRIRIKELQQGPASGSPVSVRIKGDHLENLIRVSHLVEQQMEKVKGLINIENPLGQTRMELRVDIRRELAAGLGISIGQIDELVRTALAGLAVGEYRDIKGDNYPIVVRLAETRNPRIEHLEQIRIPSASGQMIALRQVADFQLHEVQASLLHHNLERTAILSADVTRGQSVAALTSMLTKSLDKLDLPAGVRIEYGGEEEERGNSFAGMTQALIAALLGILAVLVAQFRSLSQPLIVISAIPFAITGAVAALWLSGFSFSVMAFVGLNSLVGIVVNNSIILVDGANQMRREGMGRTEAVLASAQSRLIPILLTSLTTVVGLLPLTLEGSTLWAPMGWAIIGGMLISTFLTLILVPALYVLIGDKKEMEAVSAKETGTARLTP